MKVLFDFTPRPLVHGKELNHILVTERQQADVVIKKTGPPNGSEYLLTLVRPWTDGVVSFKVFLPPSITIWDKINCLAHFRTELFRGCDSVPPWVVSPASPKPSAELVKTDAEIMVKLHRLAWHGLFLAPNSNDLLGGGEYIELPYDRDEMYGIEVVQNIGQSMYIYVVAFNAADLGIQILRSSKKPVNDGDAVRIGWGACGGDPIYLSVAEGLKQETTYLKVIVTSHEQDLSIWERDSIFSSDAGARGFDRKAASNVGRQPIQGARVIGVTVKR